MKAIFGRKRKKAKKLKGPRNYVGDKRRGNAMGGWGYGLMRDQECKETEQPSTKKGKGNLGED